MQSTTLYRSVAGSLLGSAIAAHYFAVDKLIPSIKTSLDSVSLLQDFLIFFITSGSIYTSIVVLPLLWFEKHGWKLFNRECDLDGEWDYQIKYYQPDTSALKKQAADKLTKLLTYLSDNHGTVHIKQTLFDLSIQEGTGKLGGEDAPVATWQADAAKVSVDGSLTVHFHSNLGGISFVGVDKLTVQKREKGDRGRPLVMPGHFKKVSDADNIVLTGEIVLTRKKNTGLTRRG